MFEQLYLLATASLYLVTGIGAGPTGTDLPTASHSVPVPTKPALHSQRGCPMSESKTQRALTSHIRSPQDMSPAGAQREGRQNGESTIKVCMCGRLFFSRGIVTREVRIPANRLAMVSDSLDINGQLLQCLRHEGRFVS